MTDTEKIQLAEDLYNDPSTTQKEKALLEKLFPEIKPVYFLEIPAGDVAPAEEDGPLEEDIFPESSESEEQPMDEKIRQYLIQMVNAIRADDFELSGLNKEEVLEYLEKQKEAKDFGELMNKLTATEQQSMFDAWEYDKQKALKEQKEQPAESDAIKGGDFISDGKRVFLVLANVKERNLGETGSTFCEGHILGVDGVVYCDGGDFKKFKRATSDERAKFIHDLKVGVKLKEQPAEWSEGEKENLFVDFLISLGYPIDANGNIPNYNETFESCKSALVYWLQQNLQKMLANKRIEPDGIKTETLLKDSYIQAYREGIEDSIRELSSQCENSSSQPHWKPSEEQMKALKEATDKHWEPDGLHPLYTLYNDLQKLL